MLNKAFNVLGKVPPSHASGFGFSFGKMVSMGPRARGI